MNRRLFLRRSITCAGVGLAVLLPWPLLAADKAAKSMGRVALKQPAEADDKAMASGQKLLMIDAGHGGKDPGAVGRQGLYEKDVTLDIARRLAENLAGKRKITPQLTRDSDIFIPLAERVAKAQQAHADFFISIHADSAKSSSAQGFSAYSLSEEASDEFAQELAKQENLADRFADLKLAQEDRDVANILFDLVNRETQLAAVRTKVKLVKGVERDLKLLHNPIRSANFAVLRAPDVPSILIESGFLSNAEDEKILRQPRQRQKIANLLAREIGKALLET